MRSCFVMHAIPDDTIILASHNREANFESEFTFERYDQKGKNLASFISVWDVCDTAVSTILLIRVRIDPRWEAVVYHPCRSFCRVARADELLFEPSHRARRLVTSLDSILQPACRAVKVAIIAKLALKTLKMEIVVLAAVHHDDIFRRNDALNLILLGLFNALFVLVVKFIKEVASANRTDDLFTRPACFQHIDFLLDLQLKLSHCDSSKAGQGLESLLYCWLFLLSFLFYRSVLDHRLLIGFAPLRGLCCLRLFAFLSGRGCRHLSSSSLLALPRFLLKLGLCGRIYGSSCHAIFGLTRGLFHLQYNFVLYYK